MGTSKETKAKTARNSVAKKTTARPAKPVARKKVKPVDPWVAIELKLTTWLASTNSWDHQMWLDLLASLENDQVDVYENQDRIGQYLEEHRAQPASA